MGWPSGAGAFSSLFDTIQTEETDKGVAMFSRTPATTSAYEARIDALFAGEKAAGPIQGARVLGRSDVLGLLGFGDGPVNPAEGKVIKGQTAHPHMTAAQWKKLPEWLDNPAAVFDSDTVPGSLVLIAPESINDATVRMTVEPRNGGGADVHILTNAYDAPGGSVKDWPDWLTKRNSRPSWVTLDCNCPAAPSRTSRECAAS